MLIHELTEADCHDILSRTRLARLACSRADQPYVVPVSFSYDPRSNCLYCFSAVGKKIEWMRENPKVCAEIEDIQDRTHWSTVVVVGRYDESATAPKIAPHAIGSSTCFRNGRASGGCPAPRRPTAPSTPRSLSTAFSSTASRVAAPRTPPARRTRAA
jgi:nitroimidazol reductase NimA-like FMN-containing flavoprotein (pyridoxamine 5'-phosphate oxidase superfamily)